MGLKDRPQRIREKWRTFAKGKEFAGNSEVITIDNGYITRQEHAEYTKRMEDEHKRQNHRISELEKAFEENHKLLISVEKLALNMENMQKEQQVQGRRLEVQGEEIEELKSRDGEKWRKVTGYVFASVVGVIIGFLFKQIGM